ncbi:MAG: hypothetical protein F6K24_55695 [Okeania sp. SIO2D1]|nr:hypothetical protein [Okeania sp. SIO2D1]
MTAFDRTFQIDEPHRYNQNPVGANRHLPLLRSIEMKTTVRAVRLVLHRHISDLRLAMP